MLNAFQLQDLTSTPQRLQKKAEQNKKNGASRIRVDF